MKLAIPETGIISHFYDGIIIVQPGKNIVKKVYGEDKADGMATAMHTTNCAGSAWQFNKSNMARQTQDKK